MENRLGAPNLPEFGTQNIVNMTWLIFLEEENQSVIWKIPLFGLILASALNLKAPVYISTTGNTQVLPGKSICHQKLQGMKRSLGCVSPPSLSPPGPWAALFYMQSKEWFFFLYPKWEQCFCIYKSKRLRHICSYLYWFCGGCKIAYAILMKLYLNFITSISNHVMIALFPSNWAKMIFRFFF